MLLPRLIVAGGRWRAERPASSRLPLFLSSYPVNRRAQKYTRGPNISDEALCAMPLALYDDSPVAPASHEHKGGGGALWNSVDQLGRFAVMFPVARRVESSEVK